MIRIIDQIAVEVGDIAITNFGGLNDKDVLVHGIDMGLIKSYFDGETTIILVCPKCNSVWHHVVQCKQTW